MFCKLEAEGKEFVMFLRFSFLGLSTLDKFKITLEQIIQTVKGQGNYGNRIFFKLFLSFFVWKNGKNIVLRRTNFFPCATLQKKNEISNQNNLL